MNKDLICIGKATKTHGVKGDLVAFFYTDNFDGLKKYKNFYAKDGKIIKITFKSKPSQHITDDKGTDCIKIIVNLNGINDINKVSNFIGSEIFIDKAEIDVKNDEFLISDLIGLTIYKFHEKDFYIGFVKEIHDFGGGTIVEIQSEIREFQIFNMFNFDNQSFPELDLQNKKIYLSNNLSEITDLEDDEDFKMSDEMIEKLEISLKNYRDKF